MQVPAQSRYEWPDHRPQGWTRAVLLCLGLGPELSAVSVRLRANPREATPESGQPALGKEYLGPRRALLARNDSRPVKVCGTQRPVTSRQVPS